MNKAIASLAVVAALALCACAPAQSGQSNNAQTTATTTAVATTTAQSSLAHRYASASEGRELLASNTAYYNGLSQNDIDYRMQKVGATLDELKAFYAEQVRDFTTEETKLIDEHLAGMMAKFEKDGYHLPPLDEIVFVKTTMKEECGAGGYTHGTTIYLGSEMLEEWVQGVADSINPDELLWHEIFHCLTRCNPDFRTSMYQLINFTTHDKDYTIPASVFEYHISNPDVEHHDSSALFNIDGKDIECFCDFVTTKHFEKPGDNFFASKTTALVPVDGSDLYYTPEQASNFNDIFGTNTNYVVDPEECMADNFAYALTYGTAGKDGKGWQSPQIIEGVQATLKS